MKRVLLFIGVVSIAGVCYGQQFSVDEFLEVSAIPAQKLNNYISKKGYTPAGKTMQNDTIVDTWQQAVKLTQDNLNPAIRRISKYQNGKSVSFSYQTPSREEYIQAISILKKDGFFCGNESKNADSAFLFQKMNMTVQTFSFEEEGIPYYSLFFHREEAPAHRNINYAEDLLQFTSHEYLSNFFGADNVKKDLYFFSEKEINKCSVLFPNSTRQVVFIWKDEDNLMELSHILIGGNMSTRSSLDFNNQIRENTWTLSSGVRFNMRLAELIKLNGQDFSFFGRNSDNFLTVSPSNNGEIDFSSVGIVLDCLNCESSSLLNKQTILASEALDQHISLYVGIIMLMPPVDQVKKIAKR